MFAGGLDFSSPVKKFFFDPLGSGKAFVATVVSLTGGLPRCPPCRAPSCCCSALWGVVRWPEMADSHPDMQLAAVHGGCIRL